ncbi:hypothetical protein SAMN04488548_10321 [Gordonia westfalica]|uniref:Uncharacterized protein n=1 Tax=Gordonia westfalica TaxID=158898 RepID=A0A1H2DM07_9ACTN|nr:hypothetical protein SAMN04488548_10321 [Gordonia westfalica]
MGIIVLPISVRCHHVTGKSSTELSMTLSANPRTTPDSSLTAALLRRNSEGGEVVVRIEWNQKAFKDVRYGRTSDIISELEGHAERIADDASAMARHVRGGFTAGMHVPRAVGVPLSSPPTTRRNATMPQQHDPQGSRITDVDTHAGGALHLPSGAAGVKFSTTSQKTLPIREGFSYRRPTDRSLDRARILVELYGSTPRQPGHGVD